MKMNKKGFLRTIEAVIAIIIVLGLILFLTPARISDVGEVPGTIEESQKVIVEEVSYNETFRSCILKDKDRSCIGMDWPCSQMETFVRSNIPSGYDFNCEICDSSVSCVQNLKVPVDKTVYARDIFIAGEPSRVFRVYIWQR